MVAIEHQQKSAIIPTNTTTTSTSAATIPTEAAIAPTEIPTTLGVLTIAEPTIIDRQTRRSSDIENSNNIGNVVVLSPTSSTNSPTTTIITITAAKKDTQSDNQIKDQVLKLDKSQNTKMSQSSSEASTVTVESAATAAQIKPETEPTVSKSAVSQRNVDIKIAMESNKDAAATQELSKKVLKLDLSGMEPDECSIKSPRSPIASRLPHQSSLNTVDVEDRKTLREALYQGIFHRHRRTIFAVGSFLRMLRSRNSSYNTIRSSSEGEDVDEAR